MKPYPELTRRGRLRRLRRLAETALQFYGLSQARLSFLQYFTNIIYRVDVPGPSAVPDDGRFKTSEFGRTSSPEKLGGLASIYVPNRYVLRIHAMGDIEALASELTWLAALSQEAGLPVPAPIPTPDGQLLVTVLTRGIPEGRIVSLMRWLDGRRLSRGLGPKHLAALGHAMARMHAFSAAWEPPDGFTRPEWDWDAQLGGSLFDYSLEELVASMPRQVQEPFEAVSRQARQIMESLGKGADAYGLIHADLVPENVLFKGGEAYPIDFEDCGFGYWMDDIAIALSQWAWEAGWERMRDAFREGYAQVRTLPESQWALLDLFIAAQFATMVLWASAFLKDDPMRAAEHIAWRDDNINKLLSWSSL